MAGSPPDSIRHCEARSAKAIQAREAPASVCFAHNDQKGKNFFDFAVKKLWIKFSRQGGGVIVTVL
jgi:hypothetical protein